MHKKLAFGRGGNKNLGSEMWRVDKILRVVMQQNATILYYSILENLLLLWVLQPDKGLVRFYSTKMLPGQRTSDILGSLVKEAKPGFNYDELQGGCDNRALPLPNTNLTIQQESNEKLSKQHKRDLIKKEFEKDNPDNLSPKEEAQTMKSAERKLFDLLVAPVADILSEIEGGHVIIVPDKELYDCPFPMLQDWNNKNMIDRFKITYIPSLYLLEKSVLNELDQLKAMDDLEFQRFEAKYGGLQKHLTKPMSKVAASRFLDDLDSKSVTTFNTKGAIEINPMKTSYPRIVKIAEKPETRPAPPSPAQKIVNKKEQLRNMLTPIPQPSQNKMVSTILNGVKSPRTPCLPAGYPPNLPQILGMHTLNTLTTSTSTKTDIVCSSGTVTEYKQISDVEGFVVIGSPTLPDRLTLRGKQWHPPKGLESEHKEVLKIASYLEVDPIMGKEATKDRFLSELATASVIHITTYGCAHDGSLVMTPNPVHDDPPTEGSYLVTHNEISSSRCTAKLVILSAGWSSYDRRYEERRLLIPSAFILAGAQCVLHLLWPVTDVVLEKFYYHFYEAMQKGSLVTSAVKAAVDELRGTEGYYKNHQWGPFLLIGKDVSVDLNLIKHAMMDQTLDRLENDVIRALNKNPLNLEPKIPVVPEREANLHTLQIMFMQQLAAHKERPEALSCLLEMLDTGLKRLQSSEANSCPATLDDRITNNKQALDFLKFLGFHFQPNGANLSNPYIVYPHWDLDELLLPAYDALRALQDIAKDKSCCSAVMEYFPAVQENISHLVDLLSITKHAAEIQLKVSDLSIKSLWSQPKAKALLQACGFKQIGMLLNFNRTPANKKLLNALLQFLLSISSHKSSVLMHKLDVNLLGTHIEKDSANQRCDVSKLSTLSPIMLPRNQVYISKPWMSKYEQPEEMEAKMNLAKSRRALDADFKNHAIRARSWQQATLVGQAQEHLDQYGKPKSKPTKIKVIPGPSTSHPTVPVEKKPVLSIPQTDDRRDYAHFVLLQRLDNIAIRQHDATQKAYLPYIPNK